MDELWGGDTYRHSPSPGYSPWFSSCQRHAASISLAAFHLFGCQQWTENCHSCTLLDIAGWQPLGLLLCDRWVKSCNCLQRRGIWDTSPVLGCKHIHLSAVVTRMIKRGKMERDKMSVEDQLDEKGKKEDQKGDWFMDLHLGQGIHTLRNALTYSCPLPILRHIEAGLDCFMPRVHWCCTSSDKEVYTDVLPCYLSFFDFLKRDLDRDGKQTLINFVIDIPVTLVSSFLYPQSDYGPGWTVKTAAARHEVKILQSLKAASHSHLGIIPSLPQNWQ